MIEPYRAKLLVNLKKTKGQLDRIIKMVEEERYCLDIAQQNNAAMGLLRQANVTILESHLQSCGVSHLASKDEQKRTKFIQELLQVCSVTNR